MRNYAWRRHKRYVKAARRLAEDRAQHGNPQVGVQSRFRHCPCFEPDGRTFSFWADNPCMYSDPYDYGPTMQERRAPTVKDWEDWA